MGRSGPLEGLHIFSVFSQKWCAKGRILGPLKSRNRLKIALLSKDRHLYPLKTASGSGSWKNMKFNEKWTWNRCFLRVPKAVSHYTLRLFSTLASFGKGRKIDAKMAPKMHENWSKMRPGADQGRLIVWFLAFWTEVKKSLFFGTFPVAPKSRKIGPGRPREPFPANYGSAPRWARGARGPRGGAFFARRYQVQRY